MDAPQSRPGCDPRQPRRAAIADDVGDQDCRHSPGFAQLRPSGSTKRYHRSQLPRARAEADYSGKPNIRAPRIIFFERMGLFQVRGSCECLRTGSSSMRRSRAAILTPSPIRSPARPPPRRRPDECRCETQCVKFRRQASITLDQRRSTSIAQRTASTTLRNSMIEPPPARLTMRP